MRQLPIQTCRWNFDRAKMGKTTGGCFGRANPPKVTTQQKVSLFSLERNDANKNSKGKIEARAAVFMQRPRYLRPRDGGRLLRGEFIDAVPISI